MSWRELDTMRQEIVLRGGEDLYAASWLALVPLEHRNAILSLVIKVGDTYLGLPATRARMEQLVHELYEGVVAYFKELEHLH